MGRLRWLVHDTCYVGGQTSVSAAAATCGVVNGGREVEGGVRCCPCRRPLDDPGRGRRLEGHNPSALGDRSGAGV